MDRRRGGELVVTLGVRGLGEGHALARRAAEAIRQWHAAGRPSTAGMRVRAYPVDSTAAASEDAIVVTKRWHRFLIDWPDHSHTSR